MTKNRSKFYAVVFGMKEGGDPLIGGEIIEFDTQKELNQWLTVNQLQLHEDIAAARNSFLQIPRPDGRAVVIIRGNRKVIKTQVLMA